MSEFDDKLGQILSDQSAMEQIMALAQSLSGEGAEASDGAQERPQPLPDLGKDAQLLGALRPYLRPERQGRLDRMVEILRLLRLMRGV